MMSPPLDFSTDLIAPYFAEVDHSIIIRAVRELVARGKRPD